MTTPNYLPCGNVPFHKGVCRDAYLKRSTCESCQVAVEAPEPDDPGDDIDQALAGTVADAIQTAKTAAAIGQPDFVEQMLARETAGENRKTLIESLTQLLPSTAG